MKDNRTYVGIDKDLWGDIKDYAKENGLNPTKFANELLKKVFMYEKYGDTPFASMKTEMDNVVEEVMEHLKEEKEAAETEEVKTEQEINYEPMHTNNDLSVEFKVSEEAEPEQPNRENKRRKENKRRRLN